MSKHRHLKRIEHASLAPVLVVLTAACGFSSSAVAQDAPPAAEPAAAQAGQTSSEDIIVYARKRSETVVNIPLAVTALGAEQLKQQSINQVADLGRTAPNVILRTTNSGAGTIDAIIRGQVISIQNIGVDPPVGFYFDDVVLGQAKGSAAGVFDLQSVEIARGVQGTLRGRNNTGGSISFYTHKPEIGKWAAEVGGAYGSRDYMRGQAILNVPIAESLALRFGYQLTKQDGQGRSIVTGQELGELDQQLWRASALLEPSSDFSIHAVYEHVKIDQAPAVRRALPNSGVYNALITGTRSTLNASGLLLTPSQIIPDNFFNGATGFVMPNDKADVDFWRGTLRYDIADNLQFKTVVGYRTFRASGGIDLDGSPALSLESDQGGTSRQFTVEPQFSGTLFDDKFDWVAGYFHFSDKGALIADTFAFSPNAAAPTVPFRNHIRIRERAHNVSDAGYVHGEFKVTDRFELAAGVRYTKDKRSLRPSRENIYSDATSALNGAFRGGLVQSSGCLFSAPFTLPDGTVVLRPAGGFVMLGANVIASGACPNVELSESFDYWSYEATARYELTDELHAYARTGRGQKSGGFNTPAASTISQPFRPEEVTDYEIGLKGARVMGGMLDFNFALFYSDYKDMQRFVSTLLPGGLGTQSLTLNVGAATIKGVEFDFNLRPVEHLTINGFIGYTDAEYDSFDVINAAGETVDLSGQPFVATPKLTSRLGAIYEIPMDFGTFRIGGGWNHQSKSSLQVIAFPGAIQKKTDLFDARISWTSPDEDWEVALWGTNLTNEKYFYSAQANRSIVSTADSSVTNAYGLPADKRFLGVSATWRYGN